MAIPGLNPLYVGSRLPHQKHGKRLRRRKVLIPCMSGLVYHEARHAVKAQRDRLNPLYVGSRLRRR